MRCTAQKQRKRNLCETLQALKLCCHVGTCSKTEKLRSNELSELTFRVIVVHNITFLTAFLWTVCNFQQVKKFPAYYKSLRFIAMLAGDYPSWARWMQSTMLRPVSLKYPLILFCYITDCKIWSSALCARFVALSFPDTSLWLSSAVRTYFFRNLDSWGKVYCLKFYCILNASNG